MTANRAMERLALIVVALCAHALPALASEMRLPAGPMDVPIDPASPAATRFAQHAAEAKAMLTRAEKRAAKLADSAGLGWMAADFAHLPKSPWRIYHQDVTVELFPAISKLLTKSVVTVRAHDPGIDNLQFVVRATDKVQAYLPDGIALKIDLDAQGDYAWLKVALPAPLTVEVDQQVVVERTTTLDCKAVGIGILPCNLSEPFRYVESRWYLLDAPLLGHQPATSALHVITSDPNLVAAAPGKPLGKTTLSDGKIAWHFEQKERTENGGIALAPYTIHEPKEAGPFPALRLYVQQSVTDAVAKEYLDLLNEVGVFYMQRFGPFAWQGLNVIQLTNQFGGGYAPLSAIFVLRDTLQWGSDQMGFMGSVELLAHELGHQWWGNLVEPLTNGDVALSESLAEYSSCLFTEIVAETRSQIVRNNLSFVYTVSPTDDRPVGAQNVYYSPKYVAIVYHKGSVVMDMLRRELGDDLMAKVLTVFAKEFNRDFARIDDLRMVAEKVAGRPLKWFFSQWFDKPGALRAEVSGRVVAPAQTGGPWQVRLRVVQAGDVQRRFKLPVLVVGIDGKSYPYQLDVIPQPNQPATVVSADVPIRPMRVRIDPERVLLRTFAVGTPGDVNLDGLTDGADLVDLAFRYGRRIVATGKSGQKFFTSDPGWSELHDVKPDYALDAGDRGEIETWFGTQAEEF
jgi:hypothetical protein